MCCRAIKTKVIEGAVIAYQSLLVKFKTNSEKELKVLRNSQRCNRNVNQIKRSQGLSIKIEEKNVELLTKLLLSV